VIKCYGCKKDTRQGYKACDDNPFARSSDVHKKYRFSGLNIFELALTKIGITTGILHQILF
jgi:hypothetical protein